MFVFFLVLLSFFNASLFEHMEKESESNAADCAKLLTSDKCDVAGVCIWNGTNCTLDLCAQRTLSTTSACKTGIADYTCERITLSGAATYFCVNQSRVSSFDTQDKICSLEWGQYKAVEMAACKTLTACGGKVDSLAAEGETYYVCRVGVPDADPCTPVEQNVCAYVGECMWEPNANPVEGDPEGFCVGDPCWEKTLTSSDVCREGCVKGILNPGGTPELGYCKSTGKSLHSVCNVGTATNIVTKQVVCTWTATKIPENCNKIATINNFGGSGEVLYVCNPEGEEFTVAKAAISFKPITVVLSVLILLISLL